MKRLIQRWKAKTPLFWIKTRDKAITVAILTALYLLVNASLELNLHHILVHAFSYIIVACITVAITSQLTIK